MWCIIIAAAIWVVGTGLALLFAVRETNIDRFGNVSPYITNDYDNKRHREAMTFCRYQIAAIAFAISFVLLCHVAPVFVHWLQNPIVLR